jgi:predicted component of type VI protein secretion system
MAVEPHLVPELIETTGKHAGRMHPLPYGEHVLGRGAEASIVLDDKDVSRRHARLEVGPDGVIVHDLGSKNGVFVSGRRIGSPVLLRHGQSFRFGELELTVSHPASQVKSVLAAAGEVTLTTTRSDAVETRSVGFVVFPIAGVVLFGVLVAALLLM